MKKLYTQPAMQVINIDLSDLLCLSTDNNAGIEIGGGGHGPSRAPRQNAWSEWEGQ